jgi:hypothetical protein
MKFPDIDYSNPIDIANKVMGPMRIVGRILFQSLCIKPDVDPKPEGNTECFWAAFSSCDGEWPAHVTFRMLEPLAEAIKAIS